MQTSGLSRFLSISLTLWILVYSHNSTAACSDASNSSPARPQQSEHQQYHLNQIVHRSMLNNQTQSVSFSATIDRTGKLSDICCFSAPFNQNRSLRAKLIRRLTQLHFEAAVHQNKPVSVFAHITLNVTKTGDGVNASILMHQPLSTKEFGADYLSPQRIAPRPLWQASQTSNVKLHSNDRPMWGEIMVDVKRNGTPSNAQVGQIKKGSKRKFGQFVREINRQCFIPGFANGKAVDMPYTEVFHNLNQ